MHRGAVEFRFKEDADTLKCEIMTCDWKNSSHFCKNFAEKFLLFWHSLINSIHVLDNLLEDASKAASTNRSRGPHTSKNCYLSHFN